MHVPPTDFLRLQIDTLFADVAIHASKIGMLGSAEVTTTMTSASRTGRRPGIQACHGRTGSLQSPSSMRHRSAQCPWPVLNVMSRRINELTGIDNSFHRRRGGHPGQGLKFTV